MNMYPECQNEEVLRLEEQMKPLLHKELRDFFFLGVQERTNQIMPDLETIAANIDNKNLSDADFRQFIGNTIPVLIERLRIK